MRQSISIDLLMSRVVRRSGLLWALVALSLSSAMASAQRATSSFAAAAPAQHTLRTIAERRFDAASGLRASTAFAMTMDANGVPWLATDDGVYSYAGAQWRREPMPEDFENQQVRSLLFSEDGSRWTGTRTALIRRTPDGRFVVFNEGDALSGTVVFSLVESDAIDGRQRVVAGTSRGVAWFNGTTFESLALPEGFNPLGIMLAATRAPDGASELWVASSLGGVARLHRNTWTVFGQDRGLDSPDVQYLVAAVGDTVSRVYAAGDGGVFRLQTGPKGDRFELLAGSPQHAYRVDAVPDGSGSSSLWVGTLNGRIWHAERGTWQEVPSTLANTHSTITLLRHLVGHGGNVAVYASSRSGYLVRLSQGVAATLSMFPDGAATAVNVVYAERGAGGRDDVWAATQEMGLLLYPASGGMRRFGFTSESARGLVTDIRRVSLAPPLRSGARSADSVSSIVVVANGLPWRLKGEDFVRIDDGLGAARVNQVQRLIDTTGEHVLLAGTSQGIYAWNGARWVRRGMVATQPVTALGAGIERGRRALYLGSGHTVTTLTAGTTRVDTMLAITRPLGLGTVRRICTTGSSTSGFVFALDYERGIYWRRLDDSTAWRPLPLRLRRVLSNLGTADLDCLGDGRLAVGTFAGLALFDVSAASTDAWRILSQVSDADGLPANSVTSVAMDSASGILWAGTGFGIGLVDVARAAQLPPARLTVRVTSESQKRIVVDGAKLTPLENDLHVEPLLLTFHREELTRFRVQLTDRQRSAAAAAADSVGGEWLEVPNRYYHDIRPGDYTLTVWAYDWAGREYGPVQRRFSMATSAWESPLALVAYGLVLALALTGAYQWRMAAVRRSTQQLLERERQADAERAWFQEQVREAQKLEALGTLAGGVAHDFNNLLGVIRGNAELARTALRKGRSNGDNLGAILDASDRARDIVRQILTFSRRSTPTREYVNLSRLVLDLQPLLRRMVPRTVKLMTVGAETQYLVQGDPTQLQQLLLNLVSNAEYALRNKVTGAINIVLSERTVADDQPAPLGQVIVLQVHDTGDGMDEETRQRIFEPFFTTKPTGEGTGLGMAVVHGIVMSHGGRADVISAPDSGTTFEILFPKAVIEGLWDEGLEELEGEELDALSPTIVEDEAPETSPFAGTTVVVVDDEPGVAQVVERALQHAGHVVHTFTVPEQALAFVRDQPSAVDLLITDQTMPGMTGDLLAESVHALRADLPVLILTGFSHRLTPERIAAARAQAVLNKPVELSVLRQAVNAALAGSSE
ncbi:MAG: response regulator [Gemmatimonadaceae bacterium]|nr:response regulator [Gemmatimonadaceae bacterium]